MLVRHEQLEAEKREDRGLNQLDKTVNLLQNPGGDFNVGELLYEAGGVVIVLCEEAESDCGYGVVAPTQVERLEETPILLCMCVCVRERRGESDSVS